MLIFIVFILCMFHISFPMSESFEFQKLLPESQAIVINRLDDPLIFGKTCKTMHILVRDVGKRNLGMLYKNQEPTFVHDFLLFHYVPIVFVNDSLWTDNKIIYFFSVNAYEPSFYSEPNKQLFDKEIIACGEKRLKYELQQKIIQYEPLSIAHLYSKGAALIKAILFGRNKDINHELNNNTYSIDHSVMDGAIKAAISCPNGDNNALVKLLNYIQHVEKDKSKKEIRLFLGNLLYFARRIGNKKAEQILEDFLDKLFCIKMKNIGDRAKLRYS